jgi:hypothetical protein
MNLKRFLCYSAICLTVVCVYASPRVFAQQARGRLIRNQLSGKCLDVSGYPGTANGTPLILYDCETADPNTDQRWTMTSRGFIQNQLSGKCIDVGGAPGQQNGAQLILWDCETSGRNADNGSVTDQRWRQ